MLISGISDLQVYINDGKPYIAYIKDKIQYMSVIKHQSNLYLIWQVVLQQGLRVG